MFYSRKAGDEARTDDAGAGHGYFPAADDAVHRRTRSERARAGEALAGDKKIFLSTQHDASVDDPKPEEIYAVGTLANIVQSVKLPDGNIKVLVEGVERRARYPWRRKKDFSGRQ